MEALLAAVELIRLALNEAEKIEVRRAALLALAALPQDLVVQESLLSTVLDSIQAKLRELGLKPLQCEEEVELANVVTAVALLAVCEEGNDADAEDSREAPTLLALGAWEVLSKMPAASLAGYASFLVERLQSLKRRGRISCCTIKSLVALWCRLPLVVRTNNIALLPKEPMEQLQGTTPDWRLARDSEKELLMLFNSFDEWPLDQFEDMLSFLPPLEVQGLTTEAGTQLATAVQKLLAELPATLLEHEVLKGTTSQTSSDFRRALTIVGSCPACVEPAAVKRLFHRFLSEVGDEEGGPWFPTVARHLSALEAETLAKHGREVAEMCLALLEIRTLLRTGAWCRGRCEELQELAAFAGWAMLPPEQQAELFPRAASLLHRLQSHMYGCLGKSQMTLLHQQFFHAVCNWPKRLLLAHSATLLAALPACWKVLHGEFGPTAQPLHASPSLGTFVELLVSALVGGRASYSRDQGSSSRGDSNGDDLVARVLMTLGELNLPHIMLSQYFPVLLAAFAIGCSHMEQVSQSLLLLPTELLALHHAALMESLTSDEARFALIRKLPEPLADEYASRLLAEIRDPPFRHQLADALAAISSQVLDQNRCALTCTKWAVLTSATVWKKMPLTFVEEQVAFLLDTWDYRWVRTEICRCLGELPDASLARLLPRFLGDLLSPKCKVQPSCLDLEKVPASALELVDRLPAAALKAHHASILTLCLSKSSAVASAACKLLVKLQEPPLELLVQQLGSASTAEQRVAACEALSKLLPSLLSPVPAVTT